MLSVCQWKRSHNYWQTLGFTPTVEAMTKGDCRPSIGTSRPLEEAARSISSASEQYRFICHAPFGVSRMMLDLRSDSKLSEFRPHVVLLLGIFRQLQRLLDLGGTGTNVSLFRDHETLTGKRWWIVRVFC